MDRETRRSVLGLGVLGVLLVGAFLIRRALGIEWSASSVREAVAGFGAWGPVVFILLMGLRTFLFVPSQILLVAGGLCFGALAGSLYGAVGIVVSGSLAFAVARWVGREAVLANVPPRLRWAFSAASSRAGAAVVFVGTGYPVGPVTAFHAGAGLTAMAIPVFVGALAAGGLVRAGTYAWFGSALVEGDTSVLVAAALALAALASLPLVHPRGRAWLRRTFAPHEPD